MDAMTLYVPRNSPIHHLDPLTKMLYVVVSIAAAYLLDDLQNRKDDIADFRGHAFLLQPFNQFRR